MKKPLTAGFGLKGSVLALCVLLSSCVSRELFTGYHGVVYDSTTGRPMEGVYVLAEYLDGGSIPFGHSAVWCVKTVGMHTGSDGRFSFPGASVKPRLHAIKLGFFKDSDQTFRERRATGGKAVGPPYDIYMTPQDLGQPRQSAYVNCYRATTSVGARANIEYLEILREEDMKYGRDTKIVEWAISSLQGGADL